MDNYYLLWLKNGTCLGVPSCLTDVILKVRVIYLPLGTRSIEHEQSLKLSINMAYRWFPAAKFSKEQVKTSHDQGP